MMGQSIILVLDFDPANVLGERICETLELSFSSTIHLRQDSAAMTEPVFGGDELSRIISQHDPSLIFIVIPPGLFEEAGRFFQRLRTELKSMAPVVAVKPTAAPSGGGSGTGPAAGAGAGGGTGGNGYGDDEGV